MHIYRCFRQSCAVLCCKPYYRRLQINTTSGRRSSYGSQTLVSQCYTVDPVSQCYTVDPVFCICTLVLQPHNWICICGFGLAIAPWLAKDDLFTFFGALVTISQERSLLSLRLLRLFHAHFHPGMRIVITRR